jgi:signal transduction histidine kinase
MYAIARYVPRFNRQTIAAKKIDDTGDMAEVIENLLSSYRYQISNSGFDVQTNTQPDLPAVLIDRDAMAQAISNLFDNAIKYSGEVKQLSITTKTVRSNLLSNRRSRYWNSTRGTGQDFREILPGGQRTGS